MQVKNIKSVTVVAITTEQLLSKRKSNQFIKLFMKLNGFPGGIIGKKKKKKNLPANAGDIREETRDVDSIPG